MKKVLSMSMLLLICFSFLGSFNTAEAKIMTQVNGIACCNGDLNYPIWSTGNRAGSAIDVSSSYVKYEDNQYLYIEAIDYIVYYISEEMVQNDQNFQMRYSKRTGEAAIYMNYAGGYSPLDSKLMRDTFYLIRKKLNI